MNNLNNENSINELIQNLVNEYWKYFKWKWFYKNILFEKKIIQIKKFQQKTLDLTLNNNESIKKSKNILYFIFKEKIKIWTEVEIIENESNEHLINEYLNISKEKNILFKSLNKQKNMLLDEIIMNLFETFINIYFNNCDKKNNFTNNK